MVAISDSPLEPLAIGRLTILYYPPGKEVLSPNRRHYYTFRDILPWCSSPVAVNQRIGPLQASSVPIQSTFQSLLVLYPIILLALSLAISLLPLSTSYYLYPLFSTASLALAMFNLLSLSSEFFQMPKDIFSLIHNKNFYTVPTQIQK